MGLVTDDPINVVRHPLGNTANPNTGVHGQPEADGGAITLSPNEPQEKSASQYTENEATKGLAGNLPAPPEL